MQVQQAKKNVFPSNLKINKKAIPFTMSFLKRKYLEINLIKNVQDLYTENDKTLLREIKGDSKTGEKIIFMD